MQTGNPLESQKNTTVEAVPSDEEFFCKWVLYYEVGLSRVRIWDLAIFVPNFIFFLFMLVQFNRARLKLRATSSPIFATFFSLVVLNVLISLIRCVVSMTVNASLAAGDYADKVLWIIVRFFLLSTEMSVVIFGLAFGHLESKTSIRRVLLATSCISLAFSVSQGALEFVSPDESFHVHTKDYDLFGHGGMMFWFVSSIVFASVYAIITLLPWSRLRERLALPTKKNFYYYVGMLSVLNGIQCVGSGLLLYRVTECGLCIVDVTTLLYYTFLTPFVYYTFLADFFSVAQPVLLFSYKSQIDDSGEEESVSLPHQHSFSSLKADSDYIYQANGFYDSTQLDTSSTPIHPLYAVSLRSPDSVTGYSISSVNADHSVAFHQ